MNPIRSRTLLILGFILVLLGAVIPWLIVLKIIPSTFFLNFFAYGASVAGLVLGIVGLAYYAHEHKGKGR
jgi:hypothetical protein